MGGQGNSRATIDKERGFASGMAIGMTIFNDKCGGRGFPFWHLDANAGSGWNRKLVNGKIIVDVPGSPLVFYAMARLYLTRMEPVAFFCDRDDLLLAELRQRLAGDERSRRTSTLLSCDNEEAVQMFADAITKRERRPCYAAGSLIADPNCYWWRSANGNGPPVAALEWFVQRFPRIDLILNLNTRVYRLQRGAGHAVKPPLEVLRGLKEHWLVKRTQPGGSDDFLLAIGRNQVKTGNHRAVGLHHLESDEGRVIMSIVEGKRRPSMFDL